MCPASVTGRARLAAAALAALFLAIAPARAEILSLDDGLRHGTGFDIKFNGPGRCSVLIERGELRVDSAVVSMNCRGLGIFPPTGSVSADVTLFSPATLINGWTVSHAEVLTTQRTGSSSVTNVSTPGAGSTNPRVTLRLLARRNEMVQAKVRIDIVTSFNPDPLSALSDCQAAQTPPIRNLVCTADRDCPVDLVCSSACGMRCMAK